MLFIRQYRFYFLAGTLFIVFMISAILLWNRSLASQVKKQTEALERKLSENALQKAALVESNRIKDFLLHEVNHRVNNNLQMILSLLELGKSHESINDGRGFLQRLELRVSTMSIAHEQIMNSIDDGDSDLDTLTRALIENTHHILGARGPAANVKTDEALLISADTAVSYGLLISEIYANFIIEHQSEEDFRPSVHLSCGTAGNCGFEIEFSLSLSSAQSGAGAGKAPALSVELINGMLARLGARFKPRSRSESDLRLFIPLSEKIKLKG